MALPRAFCPEPLLFNITTPGKTCHIVEELSVEGEQVPHRVIKVPGDGSCLFHSISYIVYGECEKTNTVRKKIVSYVLDHWERFQWGTYDEQLEKLPTKLEYATRMSTDGVYGTSVEMTAAAEIYKIRLEIFHKGELWQVYGALSDPVRRLRFIGKAQAGHIDVYVQAGRVYRPLYSKSPLSCYLKFQGMIRTWFSW